MKFAKSRLKSLWNNVDEVVNVYLLLTLNKVSTLIWRFFSPTYLSWICSSLSPSGHLLVHRKQCVKFVQN